MEYHCDRFDDFSLLVFKNEKLVALLPANKVSNKLYSHQGLTYGSLILSKTVKFKIVLESFKAILQFLNTTNISTLYLKLLPKMYHTLPSDEIDYLLFLLKAKCYRTDISSTITTPNKLKIQSNRMEGVKKAQKQQLEIVEESNFKAFWSTVLMPNLKEKHQVKPVHSVEEIELLHKNFPKHIRQFNVYKDEQIVAGATIFETQKVAHVQYISANQDKQQLGSLDFLFQHLIQTVFKTKPYFDFGTSNLNQGENINQGLLSWKEGFGARPIAHQFYQIDTQNYNMLNSAFV